MAPKSSITTHRSSLSEIWKGVSASPVLVPRPPTTVETLEAWSTDDLVKSTSHPGWKTGRGDKGGDFLVYKRTFDESGSEPLLFKEGGTSWRRSSQFAHFQQVSNNTFPLVLPSSPSVLGPLASSAISGMLPTNPRFNSMQAVGEIITEGGLIPSTPHLEDLEDRADAARRASSLNLSAQFGWLPLVQSCRDLYTTLDQKDKLIQRFVNGSGTRIRRKRQIPLELDVSTSDSRAYPTPNMILTNNHYVEPGYMTLTTTSYRKVWVEACFTYFVPPEITGALNLGRKEQIANHLFGTRITPSVLWEIAPWSWAADWVANTGPILKNWSALENDGLVVEYAYVMEHKYVQHDYVLRQEYNGNSSVPESLRNKTKLFRQSLRTDMKQRLATGPYNFGVTWDGLTPLQASIAASLAFTRTNPERLV